MTAHRRAFRLIRAERQMTTNNPTLTAGEAAETLGLAPSTLAKLRLSGNGPVYCKLGRRVVYRREDLEAWLETRIARHTSDAEARLPKTLTGRQRPRGDKASAPHRGYVTRGLEAKREATAPQPRSGRGRPRKHLARVETSP
jgi:predicted DNA-binding transcriptional regulator AlpA